MNWLAANQNLLDHSFRLVASLPVAKPERFSSFRELQASCPAFLA